MKELLNRAYRLNVLLFVMLIIGGHTVRAAVIPELPSYYEPAFLHEYTAPWDGGAVRIVFSGKTAMHDYLEIVILTGVPETGTYTIDKWAENGSQAMAHACSEGKCTSQGTGVVIINSVSPDGVISGFAEFTARPGIHYTFSGKPASMGGPVR